VLSPTAQIWTLYYTFTPPVSPRVFTVVQVTHLSETTPRTGYVSILLIPKLQRSPIFTDSSYPSR